MADLDDFFAKKDRKKSKGKKFATTDEVAKKLEDTTKKLEKTVKKERPEVDETSTPTHEQDEWREYEEEKKDYTGLKIGNLTLSTEEGASGGGGGGQFSTDNNSAEQSGEEASGDMDRRAPRPWRRMEESEGVPEEPTPPPPPVVTAPSAPSSAPGAYVPPSLRGQQQQQPMMASRLRTRGAPDIHNEEYFPSLSGSKTEQKKGKAEVAFEVVPHGRSSSYRQAEQTKIANNQGPKLNLGNRYNTLSNDS